MNTCDRCCADAKMTVGHPNLPAQHLYLCMHHFNANAAQLYADGWLVLDDIDDASHTQAATTTSGVTHRVIDRH